ncbi:hypothetical protein Tco_1038751, partial [Tanacetum coccineum]
LGHNLFSIGQFCDSDLEVAFRKHTCFVRNLEGVDLLSISRGSNLYTISMAVMMKSSPICLFSKSSKTISWLWHFFHFRVHQAFILFSDHSTTKFKASLFILPEKLLSMSTTQDPIVLDDSTSNPYVHQDDPRIDDENRSNEEFQTSKRQKSIDNREPKVERTKTAEVWNEFEKVQKNGVTKARCNHYGSLLEYNKQRTTTSMSRHLKFHCQKRKLVMKKQGILNFQSNGSNVSSSEPALAPAIVNGKYDHMRIREYIPHWILMHEHSFFIVEEAGFDFMMKVGIPQWPGLSRTSAKSDFY